MSEEIDALNRVKLWKLHDGHSNIPMYINLEMCDPKNFGIVREGLEALEVAKKVFRCNSLYEHHIDSACESGWITEEERDLLKSKLRNGND